MTHEPRGRGPSTGPLDPDVAQRVEGLVDEAVALAAKGGYREATARAEEALSLDPDNKEAGDLLESYRRLAADDDERRRRRRSIAAAAAAIEEMIESERLEEASTAVEALAMQYGGEAPVEDLRASIADARGLEFDELDAAFDAIRRPEGGDVAPAPPAAPRDAAGQLVAEIEDHLRAGRLDRAGSGLDQLESMHGAEDRAHKLRNRIEEARQVAEEHRRDEEILIATAAIEERIRRGAIEEAAERLTALAARHGSSAPVAELRARLQEARDLLESEGRGATLLGERDAEPFTDQVPGFGTTGQFDYEPAASLRGRAIGIGAIVLLIAGGVVWWLLQRAPAAAPAEPAGEAQSIGAADGGVDAQGGAPTTDAPVREAQRRADAAAVRPDRGAARAPAVAPPPADDAAVERVSPPEEVAQAPSRAPADPPAEVATAPPVVADAVDTATRPESAATDARSATEPRDEARTEPAATDAVDRAAPAVTEPPIESTAEVVVEALPASEAPPPVEAAPPPSEPPPSVDVAPPPPPPPAVSEPAPPPPPPPAPEPESRAPAAAPAQPAAPATAERASAAPTLLGCGDPGVVCVRAVRVPQPVYPQVAQQRRLSASVVVNALVDESGKVIETRIESGSFKFFNDAATAAAMSAQFTPASRAGVPGRSWARLSFQFAPR
jgi:TonB family protein